MTIELSRRGAVACLTIRRAAKRNAFTEAMWLDLTAHCRAIEAQCAAGANGSTETAANAAPRALLLQGEGGVFCAGADIDELTHLISDSGALAANHELVKQAQLALERLPLPTLAAIDGPCFGGGFGLAAACDFRIASSCASFAVTPGRLGLLYSLEDTRRLRDLVGDARCRRLLLRGERLDATTALAWGVVDTVVDIAIDTATAPNALAALAKQRADELAAQSRTSMSGIKATLGFLRGSGTHSQAELRAAFAAAFRGPDCAEGAAAFLQKRPARF